MPPAVAAGHAVRAALMSSAPTPPPRPGGPTPAAALSATAEALERCSFRLSGTGAERLRRERDRVVRLLRGVETRADDPEAPLLVVVGGGSGAGKSTTVNTLAGAQVTATGVLRPTTRRPTLVCHPDDHGAFATERVLPGLVRVDVARAEQAAGEQLLLATSAQLPAGAALLDIPDIDSVEQANRWLADRALDAADVWLWLATARTYADEVGTAYLRRASGRQALVAVAVTQVPTGQTDEILADVRRVLRVEGVEVDRLVAIPHVEVVDGRLPPDTVTELSDWLSGLAPVERRRAVRWAALDGLVRAVPEELTTVRRAVAEELAHAERLTRRVDARFGVVGGGLQAELEAGLNLRAEVLESWRQLVGAGEALLKVQTAATQLGGLVRERLGLQASSRAEEVQVEVGQELERIVDRLLESATVATRRDLEADAAGRALLAHHPRLRASAADRTEAVREVIAAWQRATAQLIEEVGGARKVRARRATIAINSLATSAILVLFALSGGLTAGEVGIAAGAAAASQWLLTRLLGEQNVRRLLAEMQADLLARVDRLAAAERRPFDDAIGAATPPAGVVAQLDRAAGGRAP